MKTGREFLNEHIEETNIPAEHWEIEIGEMMDWYAEEYHQAKLKEKGLDSVMRCFSMKEKEINDSIKYDIKYFNGDNISKLNERLNAIQDLRRLINTVLIHSIEDCEGVKCWNCGEMVEKDIEGLTTCFICSSEN